jgi:hypothetical protein
MASPVDAIDEVVGENAAHIGAPWDGLPGEKNGRAHERRHRGSERSHVLQARRRPDGS